MNLLITGAWGKAEENIEKLKKFGHEVRFLQFEKDGLPCDYEWVEGVVCNGLFVNHPIERFLNLKYIQLTSAGFDRVPMDYVVKHNIEIHNARGVYSIPMAEFAVAGVLSLYKALRFFSQRQQEHAWVKRRDLEELDGRTVCILGCGSVGIECAKRFEAFGCDIVGVDIIVRDIQHFYQVYHFSEVELALSKADIVVITLPLTDQTRQMFDACMFARMKAGSVLVNIARGALIDTSALVDALKERLSGAVLDVFEEEPLDEKSPLWEMDNVIITPHNSFVGSGNNKRLSNVIFKNLEGATV